MTHTIGPWTTNAYGNVFVPSGRDEHGQQLFRAIYSDLDAPDEERAANANLIAAAPDLLDALRNVTASFEELLRTVGDENPEGGPFVLAARAAIARATGED